MLKMPALYLNALPFTPNYLHDLPGPFTSRVAELADRVTVKTRGGSDPWVDLPISVSHTTKTKCGSHARADNNYTLPRLSDHRREPI